MPLEQVLALEVASMCELPWSVMGSCIPTVSSPWWCMMPSVLQKRDKRTACCVHAGAAHPAATNTTFLLWLRGRSYAAGVLS